MDKQVIGILVISFKRLGDNFPNYPDLNQEIPKLKATFVAFTPYGVNWNDNTVKGLIYREGNWEEGTSALPRVVYNRLYGTHQRFLQRLVDKLGKGRVFNEINRLDKYLVYEALTDPSVAQFVPETVRYRDVDLSLWLRKHNTFILKPSQGHYGRHIYLVKMNQLCYHIFQNSFHRPRYKFSSLEDLVVWINLLEMELSRTFLMQKWVEPAMIQGRYFEVRILLQKGNRGIWRSGATMSRIVRKDFFVSNYVYKVENPQTIFSELGVERHLILLEEISSLIGKILDKQLGSFGEIGIDFLIDKDGEPWIIEVNGKPTKEQFSAVIDEEECRDIYLNPLKYGCYLGTIN